MAVDLTVARLLIPIVGDADDLKRELADAEGELGARVVVVARAGRD